MGREATCICRWGERSGTAKVLLESRELIARGEVRGRAAFAAVRDVRVVGERLLFETDDGEVELELGAQTARIWAQKITTPQPTVAAKFGISAKTRVYVRCTLDDPALEAAMATAAERCRKLEGADIAILRTERIDELLSFIEALLACAKPTLCWIVYTKGRSAPLGEAAVRRAMRDRGLIDTKIASVSDRLSSLRFVKR